MPHSPEEKKRVLTRVRRLRGQIDALERALEAGTDCAPVLQQIAAVRGAVNGLMAGVLESHLREEFTNMKHVKDASGAHDASAETDASVDGIIELVRTYLR